MNIQKELSCKENEGLVCVVVKAWVLELACLGLNPGAVSYEF